MSRRSVSERKITSKMNDAAEFAIPLLATERAIDSMSTHSANGRDLELCPKNTKHH